MKKFLYIVAFAFFGLIVATLVHAGIEMIALKVIFGNPDKFANTYWWKEWPLVHDTFSNLLWFLGLGIGVYYGIKFWEPYGSKPGFYHWRKKQA